MCINFHCGEPGRNRLGLLLAFLNVLMALFGLCMTWVAVFVKYEIEKRTIILEGYDTGILPQFLLAIGAILFIIHVFGAKVSHDIGFADTRSTFQKMVVFFLVVLGVCAIILIAGGAMCFSHRSLLSKAFHNGLLSKMKIYKDDMVVKETLDNTQLLFKCCGSKTYEDWFSVSWVNNDYVNIKHPDVKSKLRDGDYYSDDVPFSCCRVNITRPCIFHKVSQRHAHPHYSDVTLNKIGCTDALDRFYADLVLLPVGNAVFTSLGVELLIIILLRHLQTSGHEADESGDPEGGGAAYCCAAKDADDPLKPLQRRDNLEAQEAEEEDSESDQEEPAPRKKKKKKKKR